LEVVGIHSAADVRIYVCIQGRRREPSPFLFCTGFNGCEKKGEDATMITNRSMDRVRRPVKAEMVKLYYPQEQDWSYSHHASVCRFGNRIYAMWSNGKVHEDAPGQRVLYTFSEDGKNWKEPLTLMEPSTEDGVLTAAGFHVHGDILTAYAGFFQKYLYPDNDRERKNTTLLCATTKDGENWSEPVDLHLPIVPNHGPQAIRGGRLIISGNIMFPYTDDPDGVTGWKLSGTAPFPWEPLYDDSEGFVLRAEKYGTPWVCEGSFFQTGDGVLHMLQRSRERILYVSESHDNGETWSRSVKTDMTDCGSKFHCGRLPDGRYYIVSSPDAASPRCPLILTTSRDGQDFDKEYIIDDRYVARRIEGRSKGGIYGYPHTMVDGEKMYVICSVNKEDINLYTIRLEDLV